MYQKKDDEILFQEQTVLLAYIHVQNLRSGRIYLIIASTLMFKVKKDVTKEEIAFWG